MLMYTEELIDYRTDGRLILSEISIKNLSRINYSILLLTSGFWRACLGRRIFIFQIDSCLNPKSRHKIDDFLKWDYIGAPWDPRRPMKSLVNANKRMYVGDGRFSIRNRQLMMQVTEKIARNYSRLIQYDEDQVICSVLQTKAFASSKIADWKTAKSFCVSHVYEPGALGICNVIKNLTENELSRIKRDCPIFTQLFVSGSHPDSSRYKLGS